MSLLQPPKKKIRTTEFNQLILPINHCSSLFSKDNFYVSSCNQEAFDWIQRWPRWPHHCLALHGPAGCGKTHLGHIWAKSVQALILPPHAHQENTPLAWVQQSPNILIDSNGPPKDPLFLLQLYNQIQENQGSLLLLSPSPAAHWDVQLDDLSSRLKSTLSTRITYPDQQLLQKLMIKLFKDFQISIEEFIIHYIVQRIERSFSVAQQVVYVLNEESLAQHQTISLMFVKKICQKFGFFE